MSSRSSRSRGKGKDEETDRVRLKRRMESLKADPYRVKEERWCSNEGVSVPRWNSGGQSEYCNTLPASNTRPTGHKLGSCKLNPHCFHCLKVKKVRVPSRNHPAIVD